MPRVLTALLACLSDAIVGLNLVGVTDDNVVVSGAERSAVHSMPASARECFR